MKLVRAANCIRRPHAASGPVLQHANLYHFACSMHYLNLQNVTEAVKNPKAQRQFDDFPGKSAVISSTQSLLCLLFTINISL